MRWVEGLKRIAVVAPSPGIAVSSLEFVQVERTPEGKWIVKPSTSTYEFQTNTKVPKLGERQGGA